MYRSIKQGDEYAIPVILELNGTALQGSDCQKVEFKLENIRKEYPEEVEYDSDEGCFLLPLYQQETLKLRPDRAAELDIRVKLTGGSVIGVKDKIYIEVRPALSREVI